MLVIIESPFRGNKNFGQEQNSTYARLCLHDSLMRGESPFASHLLYTQVLNEQDLGQRTMGMKRAFKWYRHANLMAVYRDHGITQGMRKGIRVAKYYNIKIEFRTLADWARAIETGEYNGRSQKARRAV